MQKNGDSNQEFINSLMSQLGAEDKKRVQSLLANKEACRRLMETPEMKKLIKQFTGGK